MLFHPQGGGGGGRTKEISIPETTADLWLSGQAGRSAERDERSALGAAKTAEMELNSEVWTKRETGPLPRK